MMAEISGIWIHSSTRKKNIVKVGPPLKIFSGSAHVNYGSYGY